MVQCEVLGHVPCAKTIICSIETLARRRNNDFFPQVSCRLQLCDGFDDAHQKIRCLFGVCLFLMIDAVCVLVMIRDGGGGRVSDVLKYVYRFVVPFWLKQN